jgi:hypothetical protein
MPRQPTPTAVLLEGERRKRPPRSLFIALACAALIAIGGVAFAAGRMTAPVAALPGAGGNFNGGPGGFQPPGGQNGQNLPGGGLGGGFGGGGPSLAGTITALDGDSLTIQMADGSTVTVNLSDDTTYAQEESTSADALATGDAVRVQVDLGSLQGQTGDEFDASSVTLTEP